MGVVYEKSLINHLKSVRPYMVSVVGQTCWFAQVQENKRSDILARAAKQGYRLACSFGNQGVAAATPYQAN